MALFLRLSIVGMQTQHCCSRLLYPPLQMCISVFVIFVLFITCFTVISLLSVSLLSVTNLNEPH